MSISLRAAQRSDADHVARLSNMAGLGMPAAFWSDIAQMGQDPMELGVERCTMDNTVFSWRFTTIAEIDGEIAGMLLSHDIDSMPDTINGLVHPMFRPIVRLKGAADTSRSINTLAVYPRFRRMGVGTELVTFLEDSLSNGSAAAFVTTDSNDAGKAFCKDWAYRPVDAAPVIKGPWQTNANSWQLLRKVLH